MVEEKKEKGLQKMKRTQRKRKRGGEGRGTRGKEDYVERRRR